MIDPNGAIAAHLFSSELSEKAIGDTYLASKVEGELFYCIFLSGDVCCSNVYGWLVTMSGWQILELDAYLQLAQEVWKSLEQTQLKERDICLFLHDVMATKGLVLLLSPILIDQSMEDNSKQLPFIPMVKPLVSVPNKMEWWMPITLMLEAALSILKFRSLHEIEDWYRRRAAEEGCARAQFELALCYFKGERVPQDYEKAVYWYRLSANQGHIVAQNNLGCCYQEGKGVPQNYAEAVRWCRLSADRGNIIAQANLGLCYEKGYGVFQDYTKAVRWYRRAAKQGYAIAQNKLGFCYEKGYGVSRDYAKAVRLYRLAAD